MTNPLSQEGLETLALRCEGAGGPDRELDVLIKEATGDTWDYAADWGPRDNCNPVAKPYTASLDAAMTLAGSGYHLAFDPHFMADEDVIRYRGYSFRPDWAKWNPHDMDWLNRDGSDYPLCATPALALCAAALRARSHLLKGHEHG